MSSQDALMGVVLIVAVSIILWLLITRFRSGSAAPNAAPRPTDRALPTPAAQDPPPPVSAPTRQRTRDAETPPSVQTGAPSPYEVDAASLPFALQSDDIVDVKDLPPQLRLEYEAAQLIEAGFEVRSWASEDDFVFEVRGTLPLFDARGELLLADGRPRSAAILMVLREGFPHLAPEVAVGVSTVSADGSLGPEEEVVVSSASLSNWQPATSLAAVAAEIIAATQASLADRAPRVVLDEFGEIRQSGDPSRVAS
jgi:hypothetical protein